MFDGDPLYEMHHDPLHPLEANEPITQQQWRDVNKAHGMIHRQMVTDIRAEISVIAVQNQSAISAMTNAANDMREVKDAMTTGIDGRPGYAEEMHTLKAQVKTITDEVQTIKADLFPWSKIISAIQNSSKTLAAIVSITGLGFVVVKWIIPLIV